MLVHLLKPVSQLTAMKKFPILTLAVLLPSKILANPTAPIASLNMYNSADDCTGTMNVEGLNYHASGKCYDNSGEAMVKCIRNKDDTITVSFNYCKPGSCDEFGDCMLLMLGKVVSCSLKVVYV